MDVCPIPRSPPYPLRYCHSMLADCHQWFAMQHVASAQPECTGSCFFIREGDKCLALHAASQESVQDFLAMSGLKVAHQRSQFSRTHCFIPLSLFLNVFLTMGLV
ncbi:hypothetical protein E2C01_005383 [Portunus trituberculatus]|uniref:Uncharacterized protein n=1 Tax=Portunus trituberculatus TaxID=210409 RepID=A0A5B7CU99_PORTR|nr:hypothetical protein [Portunus trituberculatus]